MTWIPIDKTRSQVIIYHSSDGRFVLVGDIIGGMIPSKNGSFSESLVWKLFDLKTGQELSSTPHKP
jgi:hypothetical protein